MSESEALAEALARAEAAEELAARRGEMALESGQRVVALEARIARALACLADLVPYAVRTGAANHLTRVLSDPAGTGSEPPEPT